MATTKAPVTIETNGHEFEMVNYLCCHGGEEGLLRQICRSHAKTLNFVPEWNGVAADGSPDDMPMAQVVFGLLLARKLVDQCIRDRHVGADNARAAVCRDKDVLALCDGVMVATGGAPLRKWVGEERPGNVGGWAQWPTALDMILSDIPV